MEPPYGRPQGSGNRPLQISNERVRRGGPMCPPVQVRYPFQPVIARARRARGNPYFHFAGPRGNQWMRAGLEPAPTKVGNA